MSSAFVEDFLDLSPCVPMFNLWRDNLDAHNIQLNFLTFDDRNAQPCVLPLTLSSKAALVISRVSDKFPESKAQLTYNTLFL
jgi:hypothetical protein